MKEKMSIFPFMLGFFFLSLPLSPFVSPCKQLQAAALSAHRPVDVLHQVCQPCQRPEQPRPRRRRPDREERAFRESDGVPEPSEPQRDVVLELPEGGRRRVDEPEQEQRDGRELLGRGRRQRLGRERRRGVAVPQQARTDGGCELLLEGLVRERARVLAEEGGGGSGGGAWLRRVGGAARGFEGGRGRGRKRGERGRGRKRGGEREGKGRGRRPTRKRPTRACFCVTLVIPKSRVRHAPLRLCFVFRGAPRSLRAPRSSRTRARKKEKRARRVQETGHLSILQLASSSTVVVVVFDNRLLLSLSTRVLYSPPVSRRRRRRDRTSSSRFRPAGRRRRGGSAGATRGGIRRRRRRICFCDERPPCSSSGTLAPDGDRVAEPGVEVGRG